MGGQGQNQCLLVCPPQSQQRCAQEQVLHLQCSPPVAVGREVAKPGSDGLWDHQAQDPS